MNEVNQHSDENQSPVNESEVQGLYTPTITGFILSISSFLFLAILYVALIFDAHSNGWLLKKHNAKSGTDYCINSLAGNCIFPDSEIRLRHYTNTDTTHCYAYIFTDTHRQETEKCIWRRVKKSRKIDDD